MNDYCSHVMPYSYPPIHFVSNRETPTNGYAITSAVQITVMYVQFVLFFYLNRLLLYIAYKNHSNF